VARGGKLSNVDLSAIAAFTAAGLSAVNVVFSYRLTRRGHREQWRRDQERPIIARILAASRDLSLTWLYLKNLEEEGTRTREAPTPDTQAALERYAATVERCETLRFDAAQLALLAGPEVRDAVNALVGAHSVLQDRLDPAKSRVDPARRNEEITITGDVLDDMAEVIARVHDQLVGLAREDLGLER
jgi:hypothetical protein